MRSFRGVPGEMVIDFGEGQSVAVYGDNGTGKSTIADALEWFFTGGIEFLSHEGRERAIRNLGGRSDGETSVELVTSGGLGGKVVFPDERGPEAFGVASRETFLLRGRSLADFINKTKTEKWKALAELLGLEAMETIRSDLSRARGDIKKRSKSAEEALESSRRALSADGGEISEEGVLATIQHFCRALGVAVPGSIDEILDPVWIGRISGEGGSGAGPRRATLLSTLSSLSIPTVPSQSIREWNALEGSSRAKDLGRLSLLERADALLSSEPPGGRCPLCDQKVQDQDLASRVKAALMGLLEASREMERVRRDVQQWKEDASGASEGRRSIASQARAIGIDLPPPPTPPADSQDGDGAEAFCRSLEEWDEGAAASLKGSAPETSETREQQLDLLVGIRAQIQSWRAAAKELVHARRALDLAERVYDAYESRQKEHLGEVLSRISHRVAEIYDALHPGEDLGGISVEPWTAKGVELAVHFHGSKQRPPHGVLSESHLNSLAIALFLAMAQTFNEKLRFLVLDDVINSFDLEHRGQLAELLADKFDDWQVIVLTHDHQFFEHLARRAPSWRRLELTSWSYDEGPRTSRYQSSGILGEARERLAQGDANGAATKARRALEELLQEICEALQALLPFRRGTGNDRREIGELLKGVRRAVKEHAKPMLETLEPLLKNLEADVGATLNVAAHASRGRAGAAEVEAALRRIDELDSAWSCPDCGTRIWHKGTPESSRCKCGRSVFPPPSPS
jgi:energy-coupling factor transporter ATP-binding protein EcfA2